MVCVGLSTIIRISGVAGFCASVVDAGLDSELAGAELAGASFDWGSHALGHELEIVVPTMGTGLCLVGTPLGVTVFLLLTGSCRITLINGGCRGFLGGSCSGLRCRCAASILGCIILAALAPELRPRLSPVLPAFFISAH